MMMAFCLWLCLQDPPDLKFPPAKSVFDLDAPVRLIPTDAVDYRPAKERNTEWWMWNTVTLVVSPDGRHVAAAFEDRDFSRRVFVDGKMLPYHWKGPLEFRKRPSIAWIQGSSSFLIHESRKTESDACTLLGGKALEGILEAAATPDGRSWVGVREKDDDLYLVKNGKDFPTAFRDDKTFRWRVLPDGRLAYQGEMRVDRQWVPGVGIDGRCEPGTDLQVAHGHVFFRSRDRGAVIDGKARKEIPGDLLEPVLGPGGALAWKQGVTTHTVYDRGKKVGEYRHARGLTWSPDGKLLFEAEEKKDEWVVVLDGKGIARGRISSDSPSIFWSPDGRRVAVHTNYEGTWGNLWIDGKREATPYRFLKGAQFTRDSSAFFYFGSRDIGAPYVPVLDGTVLPFGDQPYPIDDRWFGTVDGKPFYADRTHWYLGEEKREFGHKILRAEASGSRYSVGVYDGKNNQGTNHVILDGKRVPGDQVFFHGFVPGTETPVLEIREGGKLSLRLEDRTILECAALEWTLTQVYGPVLSADGTRAGFLVHDGKHFLWAAGSVRK